METLAGESPIAAYNFQWAAGDRDGASLPCKETEKLTPSPSEETETAYLETLVEGWVQNQNCFIHHQAD